MRNAHHSEASIVGRVYMHVVAILFVLCFHRGPLLKTPTLAEGNGNKVLLETDGKWKSNGTTRLLNTLVTPSLPAHHHDAGLHAGSILLRSDNWSCWCMRMRILSFLFDFLYVRLAFEKMACKNSLEIQSTNPR